MLSDKERLGAAQTALASNGVKDVKFLFSMSADTLPSQVASDAADFLEAILAGKTKPMEEIPDAAPQ